MISVSLTGNFYIRACLPSYCIGELLKVILYASTKKLVSLDSLSSSMTLCICCSIRYFFWPSLREANEMTDKFAWVCGPPFIIDFIALNDFYYFLNGSIQWFLLYRQRFFKMQHSIMWSCHKSWCSLSSKTHKSIPNRTLLSIQVPR